MSLKGLLPKPVHVERDVQEEDDAGAEDTRPKLTAPKYGQRRGWVPRQPSDFGDGGAYPEIPVAQFPQGLGKTKQGGKDVVALSLDSSGKVKYDSILRQGSGGKEKLLYSTYKDLVPVQITEDDPLRELPSETDVQEATDKTRQALEKIVGGKLVQTKTTYVEMADTKAQLIRYTPSLPGQSAAVSDQRIIRMVERQKDPMEPPKFDISKKIPRGPPSPPAPVMHSPTRKVTSKEQHDWRIPPCVSSWKNPKGFTIPLDKRLVADGRGLQDVQINDRHAKFSQALYTVERKSRESIQLRDQLAKKAAAKEKEMQEEQFRTMAQRAREERAGIRAPQNDEVRERDEIREDRRREREKIHRLEHASHETRTRVLKDKERDISERIALGLPAANAGSQHDSRLYNQSMGLGSGFDDDEAYTVYDKPLRSDKPQSIYRPTRHKDDFGDDDYERIKSTDRFRADKGFSGTEGSGRVSGPVQFEKEKEEDFGLTDFLKDTKGSGSSSSHKRGGGDHDSGRSKR
eukprot:m.274583 g.274583  ORF g.274583 m.274583 type:complete len:517 (+) comp22857_c1_seq39:49-1599(+)